jgi:hypothetical protein
LVIEIDSVIDADGVSARPLDSANRGSGILARSIEDAGMPLPRVARSAGRSHSRGDADASDVAAKLSPLRRPTELTPEQ